MNNEPVAWIQADGTMEFAPNQVFAVGQAFYIHPADLTDEEIWVCHDAIDSDNWVIDFARAILRKAQEK